MTTQNRRPVLRCVLSNAAHPEYGQVTIPFPIPVMEYERTLELLAAMELGARLKRDCRVDELESGFPILTRLEKVGANLDELDYLARRLDSFDGYEAAQFQAMAVRLGTFDMTDLINLTFCCQQATVITDFSDLEATGQTHILTVNGGHMSVDELARVGEEQGGLQGEKLEDLALICGAYDALLAGAALDPMDRLNRLAEQLEQGGRHTVFPDGEGGPKPEMERFPLFTDGLCKRKICRNAGTEHRK